MGAGGSITLGAVLALDVDSALCVGGLGRLNFQLGLTTCSRPQLVRRWRGRVENVVSGVDRFSLWPGLRLLGRGGRDRGLSGGRRFAKCVSRYSHVRTVRESDSEGG